MAQEPPADILWMRGNFAGLATSVHSRVGSSGGHLVRRTRAASWSVAQSCTLLPAMPKRSEGRYRRLAVGWVPEVPGRFRLADASQIENLRYGGVQLCTTIASVTDDLRMHGCNFSDRAVKSNPCRNDLCPEKNRSTKNCLTTDFTDRHGFHSLYPCYP